MRGTQNRPAEAYEGPKQRLKRQRSNEPMCFRQIKLIDLIGYVRQTRVERNREDAVSVGATPADEIAPSPFAPKPSKSVLVIGLRPDHQAASFRRPDANSIEDKLRHRKCRPLLFVRVNRGSLRN
jgi:hypothetical protein